MDTIVKALASGTGVGCGMTECNREATFQITEVQHGLPYSKSARCEEHYRQLLATPAIMVTQDR